MIKSTVIVKPKTRSQSHQPLPVFATRKLAGFAAQAIFLDSSQSQTRTALGTEIGTRYRYIDDTPLVPMTEAGKANSTNATASASGAKTRSRPNDEYVLYSYGEPVGMTNDSGTSYFGTDILGSVRSVTDKYGDVQADYSYDAFGSPYLGNLENDIGFGYCGKVYDIGTGLYDYGFRDYSPNNARFTTVDPIRDGSNWFSYVINDPVNYVDPLGLKANKDVKKVTGVHNDLDEYLPTRLEDALFNVPLYNKNDGTPIIKDGKQDTIPKIDTVVVAPHDFQKGIMDGSEASNGDVWKVNGKMEYGGVEYRVQEGNLDVVYGKGKNYAGNVIKDLKGNKDIKSDYYPADTPQAKFLHDKWDSEFAEDKKGYETWEDYYNSSEQYSVRKCLNEGKQKMYTSQISKSNSTNISFSFSDGIIGNNITAKNTNNSSIIDNVMDGFKSIIANGIGGLPLPTGCTK